MGLEAHSDKAKESRKIPSHPIPQFLNRITQTATHKTPSNSRVIPFLRESSLDSLGVLSGTMTPSPMPVRGYWARERRGVLTFPPSLELPLNGVAARGRVAEKRE